MMIIINNNKKKSPPYEMTVRERRAVHYKYENTIVSVAYRREMSNLVLSY